MESTDTRLRMALHAGSLGYAGGIYFGSTIQRCLTILNATHAGQIILSSAVAIALGDALPPGVQIRELGSHRLLDLMSPEQIFQASAPDLPALTQPLTTLDRLPNNLPFQPTPFIGRTREVAQASKLVRQSETRLLTLVAPSGMGKTRFSLEIAVSLFDQFPDGVYFVALAAVNNPDLVITTIAQTLGLRERTERSLLDQMIDYLRNREVLLVLDNFEQILAAASTVADLLAGTERLRIIVSSQVPLRIPDEQIMYLPPLDLPNPTQATSIQALLRYDAARLFLERVQTQNPDYDFAEQHAPILAAICARLGGLPLAIELIAAYASIYDLPTLLSEVGDYTQGSMTLPQVLQWTYAQLHSSTQRVFARLGVFAGGCTLEAAEAICVVASDRDIDVASDLAALMEKNLLLPEELYGGDLRYIMLDCVHDFARECLVIQEEVGLLAKRHSAFYVSLAEEGRAALVGPQQPAWLMRLDGEQHNLRTAFHWAIAHQDWETAVRLTAALGRFWHMRGMFSEGGRWLDVVLLHVDQVPAPVRAQVLNVATIVYGEQGDFERAGAAVEQSLALYRELGDQREMLRAQNNLAALSELQGKLDLARHHYEESLAMAKELGDQRSQAIAHNNISSIFRRAGDDTKAREHIEAGLELARASDDIVQIVEMLVSLGWVMIRQGDRAGAHQMFTEGLKLSRNIGGHPAMALLVEGFAAGVPGRHAARLLGAAEVLRETNGTPMADVDQPRYLDIIASARGDMDEASFQIGKTEGRAMSLDQAITYALEETYSTSEVV